jgi:hypothetical protein
VWGPIHESDQQYCSLGVGNFCQIHYLFA